MIRLKDILNEIEINALEDLKLEVKRLELNLKIEFPELYDLNIYPTSHGQELFLGSIKVKAKYRGKGIGGKVMKRITDFADSHNFYISLHPNPERGYKEKLNQFYKQFGFYPNKGRYGISHFGGAFGVDWIRRPKPKQMGK